MSEQRIGAMPVETLVTRLGSDAVTPGAGAAGALALAFAAACASKALAITAKHRTLPAALVEAAGSIARLQSAALRGADEDAEHFKEFLEHRSARTAEELLQADCSLLALCDSLRDLIDRISGEVDPIVAGDVSAARALVEAAAAIHRGNSQDPRTVDAARST
jgi:formiminotetrahydrofolate cyclodeaminase